MQLSSAQLAAAVRDAGLGERLSAVTVRSTRRYHAQLDGRPVLLTFAAPRDRWAGDALAAERQALTLLGALGDRRVPTLIGTVRIAGGSAELLVIEQLPGRTYAAVAAGLDERARRTIGAQLAELLATVHTLRGPSFGSLDGTIVVGAADYLAERAAAAAADWPAAERQRLIDLLRQTPQSTAAVLVHGGLTADRLLLEPVGSRWRISGLVGWQAAQYWLPAWDHVSVQQHWAAAEDFGLRVGYGAAYDGLVKRPADQLREAALWPYRCVAWLEAGRDDAVRRHLNETAVLSAESISA
jgi:hypothetical protein